MSKHKKRRKKATKRGGMKGTVRMALTHEAAVRDLASDHGITVRISVVDCGRGVKTHHWMFDDAEGRLLNYWPGTGRWHSPRTKEGGKVPDALAALDEAARIGALAYTETDEEAHVRAIARRHD